MMRYLMLTLLLCVGTLPLADPAHAIWKPKQEIESLDELLDLVQEGTLGLERAVASRRHWPA